METLSHGVVRLSLLPLRKEPAEQSEMISQLLFGEHYYVQELSPNNQWLKVRNAFDQYEGWISLKQHHAISEDYFDQINESEYKICTDLVARILFKQQVSYITSGAILPLLNNPIFKDEDNVAFNGAAKSIHQKLRVADMIVIADKYRNTPYLWGGRSPFGIDCSGFIQIVFRMAGYNLPRDSSKQFCKGQQVSFCEHQAGDLAFFAGKEGQVNHVGLITTQGQILHASGKVRVDSLDEKGIFNTEQNKYSHHLFELKRIIT